MALAKHIITKIFIFVTFFRNSKFEIRLFCTIAFQISCLILAVCFPKITSHFGHLHTKCRSFIISTESIITLISFTFNFFIILILFCFEKASKQIKFAMIRAVAKNYFSVPADLRLTGLTIANCCVVAC